jgi:hypothetical protein
MSNYGHISQLFASKFGEIEKTTPKNLLKPFAIPIGKKIP